MSGIRVRGKCPNGHVLETTAEPGRVTRKVDCTEPGCDAKDVVCRRIPPSKDPDAKPTAPDPDDAKPAKQLKVRKVAGYDHDKLPAPTPGTPADETDEPEDEHHDDDEPGPGVPGGTPPGAGDAAPDGAGEPARRRRWRRDRTRRATGGHLIPGIY